MPDFQTFAPAQARQVWLVVYDTIDGPYACAFSTGVKARDFAACREGRVIATSIDRMADMIGDETANLMQGIIAQAMQGGDDAR